MPTQYGIQPSFGKGELSPRLHARVDIDHWRIGLAECLNFVVLRQGGLRRRPGTQYVALAKGQSRFDIIRLVPFQFSVSQSYVLELGHLSMRVLGLGGQVFNGGAPYEVATPWASSELATLQFAQSGDTIYVVHRGYPPTKIIRHSELNWEVVAVDFKDGPFLDIDVQAAALQPGGTGNAIPLMTSDTAPVGVASSSGTGSFQAFDGSRATDWNSAGSGTGFLQYQFAAPTVVTGYAVRASLNVQPFTDSTGTSGSNATTTIVKVPGSLRAPRTWVFQASNDGATWTTLDTRAGETGWGDGERRYYKFTNKTAYLFYRLDITTSNSPDRYVSVSELAMQGGESSAQSITLTATGTAGINKGAGFVVTDIGRQVRLLSEDAYWHWGRITAVASPTQITLLIQSPPLPSTNRISTWRLGAFSATTGNPQAVGFFLGRLCYASTTEKPQTIYGSRTDGFDDFSTSIPLKPDDAFTFTLGEVGEIQWLVESGDLVIGTGAAIRTLGPANKNEGFSATNVSQGKPARAGASYIQPIQAGQVPIFVGRFRDTIREASYSYDAQGYVAPDISVLSEHMLKSGIVAIGYAQDPSAILWCAMGDGSLVGMTYEKEQQMSAMHRHSLGGGGIVESLCVIPGGDRHEVWLLVRRVRADSTIMRTIERLASDFDGANQEQAEAFYVDCGLSYSGAAAASFGGFAHLHDQNVGILADGATEANAVVGSDGVLTLPSGMSASNVQAGFLYESRATTLRISQGLGDGSGLGRKKRINKMLVDVMETGQVKAKARAARSYQDLVLRSASEAMGAALPLVTDSLSTHIDDQWGGQGVASVLCDGPQPATIRAITLAFDGEP